MQFDNGGRFNQAPDPAQKPGPGELPGETYEWLETHPAGELYRPLREGSIARHMFARGGRLLTDREVHELVAYGGLPSERQVLQEPTPEEYFRTDLNFGHAFGFGPNMKNSLAATKLLELWAQRLCVLLLSEDWPEMMTVWTAVDEQTRANLRALYGRGKVGEIGGEWGPALALAYKAASLLVDIDDPHATDAHGNPNHRLIKA